MAETGSKLLAIDTPGQVDDPLPKKLRDRVAALLARRNSCKEFGAGTSLGLAVHGGGKITPKPLTESVRNAVFWLRQPHTKNCSVESDVACYQLDKNIDY